MASSEVHIFSPKDKQARECIDAVTLLKQERVIALDSEGVNLGKDGPLTLLQIGTVDGRIYLFDVMKNEREQDKNFFTDTGLDLILTSTDIVKVIQSCSGDSAALYHQFGIKLENVFDTQVAHLVIQENKGRKFPSRIKLAEICKMYSLNAEVYEGKEDVRIQWNKLEGNFWAKRPMTKEMIEYASGDVTALVPEVYERQKEYIESNGLRELFDERVKEEIEYEIDPEAKGRRKERSQAIKGEILQEMTKKYQMGTVFADISDEDEIRALNDTNMKEVVDFEEVIKDLKLQSLECFLKSVDEQLKEPETFNPDRSLLFKLNDIERCGSDTLQNEAIRVKRDVVEVVIGDVQKKYTADTPVENLSTPEYQIIRSLKPLSDDEPRYPSTVKTLHWKITEKEVEEAIEKLNTDPDYNMTLSVSKLRFLTNNPSIPETLKKLAQRLLERNETIVLERIPLKYNTNTGADELLDSERMVIERLKLSSNNYGPVIESLHWKIAEKDVIDNSEMLNKDPNYALRISFHKLKFLANDQSVPKGLRRKAQTLLEKYESLVIDRILLKYDRRTRPDKLSDTERMILERLILSSRNYDPVIVGLHWKVTYEKLSKDHANLQEGTLTINEGSRKRLNFLKNDESVPDNVKQKAVEILQALPQSSQQSSRNRGRRY